MKPTFSIFDELKLSSSFFLDRVTPALLYFVPFLIIINYGSNTNVDTFSLYYSLFNSFVAIALGLTTSVKYFSAKENNRNIHLEVIILCLVISSLSAYLYFISVENRIPLTLYDKKVTYLFLLAIPMVSLFYFIASINEGNLKVANNNRSNSISLLVFIVALVIIEYVLSNILFSICLSFLITRGIMLLILMMKSELSILPIRNIDFTLIKKIIIHGTPITLLFFAQKYIQTEGLLRISENGDSASLFQMILTISLFFNLYSNAVSTNGFIQLSKNSININLKNQFLYSISMCFLAFIMLIISFEALDGLLIKTIINKEVLFHQLEAFKYFIYLFIASDMLFIIAIFYSRGVGDNFRVQCLWCISIALGYIIISDNINIKNILVVFSISALIASIYGVLFVIRKQGELQREANKI